jgi:hypothetical protein
MRMFAWLLVVLGALVIALTIPFVNAHNQIQWKVDLELAKSGSYSHSDDAGYGPGIATGACIAGFGVLLLAMRRPILRVPPTAEESEAPIAVTPAPRNAGPLDRWANRSRWTGTMAQQEELKRTLDKFREEHPMRSREAP